MLNRFVFATLAIISTNPAGAAAQESALPTTEQFQSALTTCAAGANITIDGELKGSITEIFSTNRKDIIEGRKFYFLTVTEFLKLLPEKDRLDGYKLYTVCIDSILHGNLQGKPNVTPELIELPKQITTYGKPFSIKAKTIIANNAEITSFPPGHRAKNGNDGQSGKNGKNGENGTGNNGGHGEPGFSGDPGNNGKNGGEIVVEADQLIGSLRIINNGTAGGSGGNGGNGGNGGAGGSGANGVMGAFDCRRGPGSGGSGGDANNGGDGGFGGNGGDGGTVILSIKNGELGSSVSVVSSGGPAGSGGSPGQAGRPGIGGPRGSAPGLCPTGRPAGANGASANPGRTLGDDKPGTNGQIQATIGERINISTGTFFKSF